MPVPEPIPPRRQLLQAGALAAAAGGAALWLSNRSRKPAEPALSVAARNLSVARQDGLPDLVVARHATPALLAERAVTALGGMRRFVSPGETVLVKPNLGWDRTPEQAANSNPELVSALVKLCYAAGARRVLVGDVSVNEARGVFARSGVAAAAAQAGAEIVYPDSHRFRVVDMRGAVLREWSVLEPFLSADKIINVPIAKHHSLTGVTLGFKNWFGMLGGQRQRLHQRIDESLTDLVAFVRPTLTVVDAWRVLLGNGPSGGRLSDTAERRTLVAGIDPVAVDAWAAREVFQLSADRLPYLKMAEARLLGTPRWNELRLVELA